MQQLDDEVKMFLEHYGWGKAERSILKGDASSRSYERLVQNQQTAILMNWKKVPLTDYQKQVKHAQGLDVFCAIGGFLEKAGLSVPRIFASDEEKGLCLLEDFGDLHFGSLIKAKDRRLKIAYKEALLALLQLMRTKPPDILYDDNKPFHLFHTTKEIFLAELQVFLSFHVKAHQGMVSQKALQEWEDIWTKLFVYAPGEDLVFRDFHSPNLHFLPHRQSYLRVGIIDFQDAIKGNPLYDVVSLLQDARVRIDDIFAQTLWRFYCDEARKIKKDFDEQSARNAYYVLGTQRNLRILGVFYHLQEEGKPHYYQTYHSLVKHYIMHNFRQAPTQLLPLKNWFEAYYKGFLDG